MSDEHHQEHNHYTRLEDLISCLKMHSLTQLGRFLLPDGLWHCKDDVYYDEEQHQTNDTLFLTFDDGPNPKTTPYLLEMFEEENIKATFFLVGREVERHSQLVREISDAGHVIGNHSQTHLFIPALSVRKLESEIQRPNHMIEEITGRAPTLFRPPFGIIDKRGADCLKERGMTPVYWGPVPEDWQKIGACRVVHRVMRQLTPGALIVLHELDWNSAQTIKATREIVKRMKHAGYRFSGITGGAGAA
ncbi:MAG TPA: polysaccharide deacetylase family protein [Candidatus Obscuribacterales bacterium]